jgi:hypothetical protein
VGVDWVDVKHFLRPFCRTLTEGSLVRSQFPKATTVYIDDFLKTGNVWYKHTPLGSLPLVELRLRCSQLTYLFEPDPKIHWQELPPVYMPGGAEQLIDRVVEAGKEFAKLL